MVVISENFFQQSQALVSELGAKLETHDPFGSFSPSIYDTAWLARVRTRDGEPRWLFPECFEYLLQAQEPGGGWPMYGSEMDCILGTMAALVAMKEHAAQPELCGASNPILLGERISKAEESLRLMLPEWDVTSTVHVGFEILVPALLESLEKGTHFEFPGRKTLMEMNQNKLRKFRPEMLYGSQKTTLVHSLEALVGKIDYDRVSHHLDRRGSMLGSPAATAAYLMHVPTWDTAAESYLKSVVKLGSGAGSGGVPGAFPSAFFELSWILSTLLNARSSPELLELPEVDKVRSFLLSQLESHRGLVGFDVGMLEDVDDTAKTILALNLLGFPASPTRMIEEFEAPDHFRTYRYESKGSFSANCNVLDCLLQCESPTQYHSQIIKVSMFLCREFNAGTVDDKWNLSTNYSMMLLCNAFIKLLEIWDNGLLPELPKELIGEEVPIVLCHILLRILQDQSSDGSWRYGSTSRETTAYAVLTLKRLISLPWLAHLQPRVQAAISRGSTYLALNQDMWHHCEYIWVAKTTYALPPLSRAYILASLCAGTESHSWGDKVKNLFEISRQRVQKMAMFFHALPMFSKDEIWALEGDVTLGCLYQPQLRRANPLVFSPQGETDSKYLEYIPFTWVATNRKNCHPLSNVALWEMMIISLLAYQLDEFVETIFGEDRGPRRTQKVRDIVVELCRWDANIRRTNGNTSGVPNGCSTNEMTNHEQGNSGDDEMLDRVKATMKSFTSYILEHPTVLQSSEYVRRQLHRELASCILGQIDQEEANARLAVQRQEHVSKGANSDTTPVDLSRGTYYTWMRMTAADNVQCPFIFLFFSCLAAPPGKPFFSGARQHYISSALSRHLANLCRQYNDYGSVARDRAEDNLNSLDFPEFLEEVADKKANNEDSMKSDLLSIAEYERECMNHAFMRLEAEMGHDKLGELKMNALRVYINTVDLYGQIYVAKDISNRVR